MKKKKLTSVKETLQSLTLILNDKSLFDDIVLAVFKRIDSDNSGSLELIEIESFIQEISNEMGMKGVLDDQTIKKFFNEIDTDNSKTVSIKELSNFLLLLFSEQKKRIEEYLSKSK